MSPPPAAPLGVPISSEALPRRFGRYLLFDRIGKGGMAEIFLARAELELGGGRLCVVKLIHEALSRDPSFAKMFVEEAKLSAGLRHANIAQVVDLGREGDLLFMAMEYVEGPDLLQLLRRLTQVKVPLPLELAVFVVKETLAALDFAHRATDERGRALGIVHRDVSPSNVLLSFEGEVKLCDFGIAKATALEDGASDAVRSLKRSVVGKSAYMAPEHARGEATDARADVFAAGILLWELCAGRRLYRGTEDEMLAQARSGDVPPLPARGLPGEVGLNALLARAFAKDPAARLPSARAFKDELETWAIAEHLMASQIRFGAFLEENVGLETVTARRAKERDADVVAQADPTLRARFSSRPPGPPEAQLPPPSAHSTGLRKTGADDLAASAPVETSVVFASFVHEDIEGLHMPSEPPPESPIASLPPLVMITAPPVHMSAAPPSVGATPAFGSVTHPSAPPAQAAPQVPHSSPPAHGFAMPPSAPPSARPPVVVPPGSIEVGPAMLAAVVAVSVIAFVVGFWLFFG